MSEDSPDSHQDDGSGSLGECPVVCSECNNYNEFEEYDGKWCCLACGFLQSGVLKGAERKNETDWSNAKFVNMGEDPAWSNSPYVYVPALKPRPHALTKKIKSVPKVPVGFEHKSKIMEERDFSIEVEYFRKALRELGMNPRSSLPNRSKWYDPFYDVPFDGMSEMSELMESDHVLPGPVFKLLNAGHLPPRRYWRRPVDFDENRKPTTPPDWIRPDFRIPFEMYLHLNRKLQRPWPLSEWVQQVKIRNQIGDILTKGGALSRNCETWLNAPLQINEFEVRNYFENLNIMNEFNTPHVDLYVEEAMRIINALEESERVNITIILEKLCTLIQPNDKPAEFWIFGPHRDRKNLGHIQVSSILVGLVVYTAVKREGRENTGRLKHIALADEEFTNGEDIEVRWASIMDNLALEK